MKFLRAVFPLLPLFQLVPLSAQEAVPSGSVFTVAPRDAAAVYLTGDDFEIHADGVEDDSRAIQKAIDRVAETTSYGIVFIPEGTYRVAETIHLWRGVRLIGYGEKRPVFLLAENTPGFGGEGEKYMLRFCHKPEGDGSIQDARNTSYASGIRNIDFKIEGGNPGAIAIRYHIPQLCSLENMRFDIGGGKGAVKDIGNLIEQCVFEGGEWAIETGRTAAGWQATLMNCDFRNQRADSIRTRQAGLNVIGCRFSDTGTGIRITEGERLYVKDCRFENIRHAGIESKRNFTSEGQQMNLENLAFADVPFSVRLNGSSQGRLPGEIDADYEAPGPQFVIGSFSHGIHIDTNGKRTFETRMEQQVVDVLPDRFSKDMTIYPPAASWVNVLDLGAKGDGESDCTGAFERAIAAHDVVYLPMGRYRISRTLALRPDTRLIGLHPFQTELLLDDGSSGFSDSKDPAAIWPSPQTGGGTR